MHRYSKYWWYQLAGWGSLGLIYIFFAFIFHRLNTEYFMRVLIFIILGILFTHAMRLIIQRIGLLLKPLNQQISGLLIIIFLGSILSGITEIVIFSVLNLKTPEMKSISFFGQVISISFNFCVLIFIWNCIYFIYHYEEKIQKRQDDILKLDSLIKELEQKTTKAQIDPNYIFTSLNNIRTMIFENPENARNSITELSKILRNNIKTEHLIKRLTQFFSH